MSEIQKVFIKKKEKQSEMSEYLILEVARNRPGVTDQGIVRIDPTSVLEPLLFGKAKEYMASKTKNQPPRSREPIPVYRGLNAI